MLIVAMSQKLYAGIHKQHHSFVGTISIAAEHAHPIEDALSAYLPFLAGVVLMGAHFHIVFVWFFVRLTEVYEAHSGYLFRGSLLDRVRVAHPFPDWSLLPHRYVCARLRHR
jgi:sterol desaturase/sphingolipid hydroxylase (fatty acid hydroxylase superfamily)